MTRLSTGNGFPNVVVTAVAMTTALATDAENTWKKLLDGQSGIRKLDDPFVEEYDLPGPHRRASSRGVRSLLTKVELRRLSYLQKMSTVLGRRAWANAGSPEVDTKRLMVSIGTGMGSSEELLFAYDSLRAKGLQGGVPAGGAEVHAELRCRRDRSGARCKGRCHRRLISACASGSEAIAHAWRNIVLGEADIAICGGVETRIEAVPIAGFAQMRIVLSTTNDDPAGACRPFDRDRNGFVFGEAGALFVHRDRRPCEGTWGQHSRPFDGSEHHLGRVPHRGTGSQRRTGRARDDPGDRARRPDAQRHRPRQRARDRNRGR